MKASVYGHNVNDAAMLSFDIRVGNDELLATTIVSAAQLEAVKIRCMFGRSTSEMSLSSAAAAEVNGTLASIWSNPRTRYWVCYPEAGLGNRLCLRAHSRQHIIF